MDVVNRVGGTLQKGSQKGFTLIELSIVLVIIGLIVGGVLVGQDLIKAAMTRSVISDIEKFNTAVNTFQAKYDCLPGDCVDATRYFGTDTQCANNTPLTTGACNGDGNGVISEAPPANGNNFYHSETMGFWQQLALAGLVPGRYTGLATSANDGSTIGGNTPPSRFPNSCYSISFTGPGNTIGLYAGGDMFDNWAVHAFVFGNPGSPAQVDGTWFCGMYGGPLSSAEAMSIDKKLDDGLPGSGQVMTQSYQHQPNGGPFEYNPCALSPPTGYDMTHSDHDCMLLFQAAF